MSDIKEISKITINGTEVSLKDSVARNGLANKADKSSVPTKTSQLTNDSLIGSMYEIVPETEFMALEWDPTTTVVVEEWTPNHEWYPGDIVSYGGKYYEWHGDSNATANNTLPFDPNWVEVSAPEATVDQFTPDINLDVSYHIYKRRADGRRGDNCDNEMHIEEITFDNNYPNMQWNYQNSLNWSGIWGGVTSVDEYPNSCTVRIADKNRATIGVRYIPLTLKAKEVIGWLNNIISAVNGNSGSGQ